MARLVRADQPLPQTACSVGDTHRRAGAQVRPRLVSLPPPRRLVDGPGTLVGGFAIHDRFRRLVAPHVSDALGHVLSLVSRLAPLEIKPGGVLMGAGCCVRPVVDPRRLAVAVRELDSASTGLDLWFEARAVRTDQVHHRPRAVAGHEVATVAGVVLGRNDRSCYPHPLPTEAEEDRLEDAC